jgi:hypothetical protein
VLEELAPEVAVARRRDGVARQVGGDLPEAGVRDSEEDSGLLASHKAEDLVGVKLGDLEHLPDVLLSDPRGLTGDRLGYKLLESS